MIRSGSSPRPSGPPAELLYTFHRLSRARFVLRSTSRAVLWLYAYGALEWLFHVTKPSIVSAATPQVKALLLFAGPLPLLLFVIPAQLIFSAIDSFRPRANAYWLAAVVPAAIAAVLALVLADNFVRTIFGLGVVNSTGYVTAAIAVMFLVLYASLMRREARSLAKPEGNGAPVLAAVSIVIASLLVTTLVLDRDHDRARTAQSVFTKPARRPNILLIGMDGVGAAHTSAYVKSRGTTPTLEQLSARGILFENAFSNAAVTFGSLITIVNGKLPTETHVFYPPLYLTGRDAVEHLPGILRGAGYTTAQIGMPHYADATEWNMRGGFDYVNGVAQRIEPGMPRLSESGERLERYRSELRERVTSRVLHLFFIRNAHDVYRFVTARETRSHFFADARRIEMAEQFLAARHRPWMLYVHLIDMHCCEGDYDRQLLEADANVARLLSFLRQTGDLEDTLIVFYSDHSRGWGTLERLPLIIVPPGGAKPRRVRVNVQLADISPTLLEWLGLPKPSWMRGDSLLHAETLDPLRPIFSLSERGLHVSAGKDIIEMKDFEAPLYGAGSIAVVVCDRWARVTFPRNVVESGVIEDHTAPCGDASLEYRARRLVVKHVEANGYPTPEAGWRLDQQVRR